MLYGHIGFQLKCKFSDVQRSFLRCKMKVDLPPSLVNIDSTGALLGWDV